MTPNFDNEYLEQEIEIVLQPSFTHKMLIEEERVKGYTDGEEAVKQFIYKCINTEKGIYPIYPNFGVKKRDLFGKPKNYAFVVLTRRISDALMLDDRIEDVYEFKYHEDWSQDLNLGMSFKVSLVGREKSVDIEEVLLVGY
ncbi:DUF2634 domain-containing protein [Peptoniphilus grossensis]|uniref:DUF2634 domain-containing protein n=1 Tax=Peptoniphilus grossensis TaxID=1465756 RepID=UPI0002F3FDF6|nr:DUF2634 domain-containing protein [Peptoniphilus grossensis]